MLEPLLASTNLKGPVPTGALVAASIVVQSSSVSYKCCGRMQFPYHARLETKVAFASFNLITIVSSSGQSMESIADKADARKPSDEMIFS